MITPAFVFEHWPDNDLFSFDPPRPEETYQQYLGRVGVDGLKEDRLFHFVLAEICNEDIGVDEAVHRLGKASLDLDDIYNALLETTTHGESEVDSQADHT